MALYDEDAVRKQLALMGFEDVPQELLHKFVARLRAQDAPPAPQEADSIQRHPHNPPPMSPIAEEGSDIEQSSGEFGSADRKASSAAKRRIIARAAPATVDEVSEAEADSDADYDEDDDAYEADELDYDNDNHHQDDDDGLSFARPTGLQQQRQVQPQSRQASGQLQAQSSHPGSGLSGSGLSSGTGSGLGLGSGLGTSSQLETVNRELHSLQQGRLIRAGQQGSTSPQQQQAQQYDYDLATQRAQNDSSVHTAHAQARHQSHAQHAEPYSGYQQSRTAPQMQAQAQTQAQAQAHPQAQVQVQSFGAYPYGASVSGPSNAARQTQHPSPRAAASTSAESLGPGPATRRTLSLEYENEPYGGTQAEFESEREPESGYGAGHTYQDLQRQHQLDLLEQRKNLQLLEQQRARFEQRARSLAHTVDSAPTSVASTHVPPLNLTGYGHGAQGRAQAQAHGGAQDQRRPHTSSGRFGATKAANPAAAEPRKSLRDLVPFKAQAQAQAQSRGQVPRPHSAGGKENPHTATAARSVQQRQAEAMASYLSRQGVRSRQGVDPQPRPHSARTQQRVPQHHAPQAQAHSARSAWDADELDAETHSGSYDFGQSTETGSGSGPGPSRATRGPSGNPLGAPSRLIHHQERDEFDYESRPESGVSARVASAYRGTAGSKPPAQSHAQRQAQSQVQAHRQAQAQVFKQAHRAHPQHVQQQQQSQHAHHLRQPQHQVVAYQDEDGVIQTEGDADAGVDSDVPQEALLEENEFLHPDEGMPVRVSYVATTQRGPPPGRTMYRADPVSRYHQMKALWSSDGFLKRRQKAYKR